MSRDRHGSYLVIRPTRGFDRSMVISIDTIPDCKHTCLKVCITG